MRGVWGAGGEQVVEQGSGARRIGIWGAGRLGTGVEACGGEAGVHVFCCGLSVLCCAAECGRQADSFWLRKAHTAPLHPGEWDDRLLARIMLNASYVVVAP